MQKQILWAIVIVIVLGGAYLLWANSGTSAPAPQQAEGTPTGATSESPAANEQAGTGATASTGTNAGTSAAVTYDGSSFSPSTVTIKKGDTVTFTSTGGSMWVATGPHPAHTGYGGTDLQTHCAAGAAPSFDQCGVGATYTFTFDKSGTWPYHNHRNPGAFGKVVVE